MAAVDYATGRFCMADFPFDHSSPFDLYDYILLEEGPVQIPLPISSGIIPRQQQGQLPPQVVADVGGGGSSNSTAASGHFSMTNQFASSTSSTAAGQFSITSQPLASGSGNGSGSSSRSNSVETAAAGGGFRVAFRTQTEVDVLDDGFKWRKYGKKSVKNSPNPRNYYRCSTEGCSVKKRVERDRDDPSYVITTYDGVHNHTSADVVYYATQDTASGQFVVSGRYGNIPPNS